jgi:hypothetical protein
MHCYFARPLRIAICLVLLTATIALANSASAALHTFYLDPLLSTLTASGQLYGKPYNPQGPGSFVSNYWGTVVFYITPGNIQFVGGSLIDAQHSGNWSPATGSGSGSGAADYGAFTNDTSSGQPITI